MWKSSGHCGRVGMYTQKQSTDLCYERQTLKMINAIKKFQTHQHVASVSKMLMLRY